jgi:hypothetical protein
MSFTTEFPKFDSPFYKVLLRWYIRTSELIIMFFCGEKMGFEIIDSLSQADRFYSVAVYGRSDEAEIKVSVFSRSLSIFWKAALPQSALEDAWKQTRLSLVVAKCEPVVVRKITEPKARTVKTVQAVQQFVVDSTSRHLGALITMKVKVENDTTKPITLYLVADLRDSSADEIGFDLNRKSWEQPQIRQFILNMFGSSFVHGEVTQCEIDDLTAKISQMARPQKNRKAASAAAADGISD